MKTSNSKLPRTTQITGDALVGPNACKLALMFCFAGFGLTAAESERVKLVRTPDDGIQPQAAVDSRGVVHLIYYKGESGGGDIFYVCQQPGKETFSTPIQVNSQARSAMSA